MATSIGAKPSFRYVMEKPESGQVTRYRGRQLFERRDHHQLSECQGSRYASQDHAANTAPFSTWRALRTTSSLIRCLVSRSFVRNEKTVLNAERPRLAGFLPLDLWSFHGRQGGRIMR